MVKAHFQLGRKLFFLGFLTLFLELVLIRYLSGNIWNLGYFPNLVLLAVFLGMGIGFLLHSVCTEKRSLRLFELSSVGLFLLVAFATVGHPTLPGFDGWQGNVGGEIFFTARASNPWNIGLLMFGIWFFGTMTIFVLISQRTAKLFLQLSPLTAYTFDIAGSCAGILTFMGISWFQIPAYAWLLFLIPLYVLAGESSFISSVRKGWPLAALLLAACFAKFQHAKVFSSSPSDVEVFWSPYQKVTYETFGELHREIQVNGISHQKMWPLSKIQSMFYQVPYQSRKEAGLPPYRNVLVLGAGSGNDVAAALANGAQRVDAVEIDPVIARLGKEHHPAHPYQDPRVTVTVDDGRAFMVRTKNKYDLIVFALTDSLVKVSPMSQLRLENYLFTKEAVQRAKDLLQTDGDLLFYNFYRRAWLTEKIEQMVLSATGYYPKRLWQQHDFVVMAAGSKNFISPPAASSSMEIATDDWPFLYLQAKAVPLPYLGAIAVLSLSIALLLVWIVRKTKAENKTSDPGNLRTKLAFAAMGTAFLLLETKSVIQFALLFGTTWINNSLVFLNILLLVLAANWTAIHLNRRWMPAIFIFLSASACVPLFFPLSHLLSIETVFVRVILASLITFAPIYFANLLFSILFRDQKIAEHLFGWNLIGACLGGVLEYFSLALGYSALAVIVIACYAVAFSLVGSVEVKKVSLNFRAILSKSGN